MTRRKTTPLPPRPPLTLPAHWPAYTTPEYYAWTMARLPKGAIVADWSKQHPHNSYSPLFWYEDRPGVCKTCSAPFVFTKEAQRHCYEELKFPIYAEAVRCAPCRAKIRETKRAQREHMAEMAAREPHPHEAFFKKRS